MPLSDIYGQSQAIEALSHALDRHALHHAWLFHGPDGVGKELTATRIAQALVCTDRPWVGCGTCSACARVLKRNHPDVTWVMSEAEQVERGLAGRSDFSTVPSRDIRVEQVRRLQERLAFRALEAPYKVAIVVAAHAMNVPAQNALLKTLEEPPSDTVIVLVSSSPDKLLPTIRSRCAKASFGPLPAAFIAARLQATGVEGALAQRLASIASGSLGRALAMDPATLSSRSEIIEMFHALRADDARAWLAAAERWSEDRGVAETALDALQAWFRDLAVAQVGGGDLINSESAHLAAEGAARVSPARLQRWSTLADECKNAILQRNGAARLQLERMLIEMMTA